MDAASPSPIGMLQYYKQMFAESSPLTGPFGRPGPNRIHFRHHQEASPQKGGWFLGEGPGYRDFSYRAPSKRRPSPTPRPCAPTQCSRPTPHPRRLTQRPTSTPGEPLRRTAPLRLPFQASHEALRRRQKPPLRRNAFAPTPLPRHLTKRYVDTRRKAPKQDPVPRLPSLAIHRRPTSTSGMQRRHFPSKS